MDKIRKMSEFAKDRGVPNQTVFMYMKRHDMEYDREKGLTDEQLRILDEVYPLPKPVQVINGVPEEEHFRKLQEKDEKIQALQNSIIELQKSLTEKQDLLNQANTERLLIEAKTETLEEKNKDLTDQITALKGRSLWDRILNR